MIWNNLQTPKQNERDFLKKVFKILDHDPISYDILVIIVDFNLSIGNFDLASI